MYEGGGKRQKCRSDAYFEINKANYTTAGYKLNPLWHYLLAGTLPQTHAGGG